MTVVFCLPGRSFSGRFLECWTRLFAWCLNNGIQPVLSRRYSCNIYYVRTMCLGGDVSRGKDQKPFDGKCQYDFCMWIDSDIVFTPAHFEKLLRHRRDIVSGLYLMENGKEYATVQNWDEQFFSAQGHFRFLTPGDLEGNNAAEGESGLLPVDYTGMGFMLVKRGVFESLEYPWFRPIEKTIGSMTDFTTEDVSFCLQARERGYEVLVDTTVRVGHEKTRVY
jgi:hypothetical protein